MNLCELRDFINKLPEKYNEYELVNGEVGVVSVKEKSIQYRVDKPIIAFYVDDESNEICFLHQTREDINGING